MSVISLHTVNCDTTSDAQYADPGTSRLIYPKADGCRYWVGQEPRVTEARREAKLDGWKRIDGMDLCPPCYALHYPKGALSNGDS